MDRDGKNFRQAVNQVQQIPVEQRTDYAVKQLLKTFDTDFEVWERSENRGLSFGFYQFPLGPFEFYDVGADEIFYEE